MHDSVYEIAGDDPRLAKLLRASLTRLANGPDKVLREMAEDVLAGRLDVRRAAASDVYGERLGSSFDGFWSHYERLDAQERRELEQQTQRQLDVLRESW